MSERILIKFKASGDKQLQASMMKLAVTQALLEKNTKKMNAALKRLEVAFLSGGRGSRLLNNSFATLRSKMLLFSFAMSMGGRQLVQFAKDAARLQGMEDAFNTLQGGALNAGKTIEKLRGATNKTMSDFDLFQQANNAMALGVTKNADEMSNMFDMAQRLGKALGKDTKHSVESLITGIGRQSRLMLDNIGIVVKSEKAYEEYAEKLKKGVNDLTDSEKKQAFLNAALQAGKDILKGLPDEVMTPIDSFNQLSAAWDNFTARVGSSLLDVFQPLLTALSAILDFMDEEKIKSFGTALTITAGVWGLYTIAQNKATKASKAFNRQMKKMVIFTIITSALSAFIDALGIYAEEAKEALDPTDFGDWGDAVLKAANDTDKLKKVQSEMLKVSKPIKRDVGAATVAIMANTNAITGLNTAAHKVTVVYDNYDDSLRKFNQAQLNAKEIGQRIAEIETDKIVQAANYIPKLKNEVALIKLKTQYEGDELAVETAILKIQQAGLTFTIAEKKQIVALLDKKNELNKELEREAEARKNIADAQSIIDSNKTEVEQIQEQIELYEGLYFAAIKANDTEGIDLYNEALYVLISNLKKAKEEADLTKLSLGEAFAVDSILAFGNALEQEIVRGLTEGKMSIKSFGKAFLGMLAQIVAEIIAKQSVLFLVNLMTGGTGSIAAGFTAAVGHKGGQVQGYNSGGIVSNPRMQTYQGGGGVDNVPALLQEGEFVMRRSAVDSIGLENLNRMNRTGQVSGANITFTGNIMSDSFIEEEAIPKIKDALRRGADLGIS